jgi:hypothetical protein
MAYKAFGKTSVKLCNAFEVFPLWDELDDGLRESWEESAVAVANWGGGAATARCEGNSPPEEEN